MTDRLADSAIVPDVVGFPFHIGRDLAHAAGGTLANTDPDGPPIGARACQPLKARLSARNRPGHW